MHVHMSSSDYMYIHVCAWVIEIHIVHMMSSYMQASDMCSTYSTCITSRVFFCMGVHMCMLLHTTGVLCTLCFEYTEPMYIIQS